MRAKAAEANTKGIMTVKESLIRSLEDRGAAVPAGRSFADLKWALEKLGIADGDRLCYLELGVKQGGSGLITAEDNGDGWEVREL